MGPEPDACSVTGMDKQVVFTDKTKASQYGSFFEKDPSHFNVVVKIAGNNPFFVQPSTEAVGNILKASVALGIAEPKPFMPDIVVKLQSAGGMAQCDHKDGVLLLDTFGQGELAMS